MKNITKNQTGIYCQHTPSVIGKASTAGITLVALVVTIVVLLILAGITLVYVLGDNGIFQMASEAKNSTENAIEDEKGYMNDIGNTIDKHTNGIGSSGTNSSNPDTPTPEGPTISDSSTSHTATEIDYTWEKISKIAEAIAKSDSVDSETMEVTAKVDGTELTIGVGDIATVNYIITPATETEEAKTEPRRVRVLGFKHDDLVNTSAYGRGTTATKASISFEFYDFMTGDTYMKMNSKNTNANGWGSSDMRRDLNGYTKDNTTGIIADEQSGAIGGEGAKLSNASYIKQVKKSYIKEYNNANSIYQDNDSTKGKNYTQDYLWLLASSEIVPQNSDSARYGYAITTEGSQYQYYQGVKDVWNTTSDSRKKYNASGSASYWWLRSPNYGSSTGFCRFNTNGNASYYNNVSTSYGVAPGFAI